MRNHTFEIKEDPGQSAAFAVLEQIVAEADAVALRQKAAIPSIKIARNLSAKTEAQAKHQNERVRFAFD
jgi:hypothetical protein